MFLSSPCFLIVTLENGKVSRHVENRVSLKQYAGHVMFNEESLRTLNRCSANEIISNYVLAKRQTLLEKQRSLIALSNR